MDTLSTLVQEAVLPAVIFAVMVTIGMELTQADFRRMLKSPRAPIVGILAQALIFPCVALALLSVFDLAEATAIGLAILASCPSGGFSNVLTLLGRGDLALSITLTSVSSLLAIFSLPLLIWASMAIIEGGNASVGFADVPLGPTLGQLFGVVLVPVIVGMVLRARYPIFVARNMEMAQRVTQIVLYAAVAALAVQDWGIFERNVSDALPVATVMALASMALGYMVPRVIGLREKEAFTIAIETATRNVGLSTLIAANVLKQPEWVVFGAIYMLPGSFLAFLAAVMHRRVARVQLDQGRA